MRNENSEHNVYVSLGASNHTDHIRSKNDFYATPPLAVRQLLEVAIKKIKWSRISQISHAGPNDRCYEVNLESSQVIFGDGIHGKIPPAINGVLAETDLSNKKLSFVFYAGSGAGKGAAKKIKKLFPDAKVIFLKEPKKYPEELDKVKELFK